MPRVVKHAWTHRPRSQGGTDPIESADMIWANATGTSHAMADAGAYYIHTFNALYSNSTTAFTEAGVSGGRFDWIQLNEPGYYMLKGAIFLSGEYNTIFTRIDPAFELSGARAEMQTNSGVADFQGTRFNRASEQDASENAHPGYYSEFLFSWNPANPVNDFDFENPLKVGLNFSLAGGPATMTTLGGMLYVVRLAAPGYNQLYP